MTTEMEQLRDQIMGNSDLPFTAGHLRWLSEGGVVTPAAFKRLMEVQLDDYFRIDRSDGSGRLRASGFGSVSQPGIEYCERQHILSYIGAEADAFSVSSMEMMNTGTQLHYYYQLGGLSSGWLADIEVPLSYEPWKLRGSMDGLITDGTGLEIKTTGSTKYSKINSKRVAIKAQNVENQKTGIGEEAPLWKAADLSHLWQIHMYMMATEIDKFSLVYIDRGWPSRFMEFRVERDDKVMEAVDTNMKQLAAYARDAILPPMLENCQKFVGKTYEGCRYRTSCPTIKEFP